MNLLIALRIPTVDGWFSAKIIPVFKSPISILIFIATVLCKLITGDNG